MRVISYTLHQCIKCMHCLKNCPTEAITIHHERVNISADKCINCGKCISVCQHAGLTAKGSTLVDKNNYDRSVCLVPTSIYADCSSIEEVEKLNAALEKLGFDEYVYLGEYEGNVYAQINEVLEKRKQGLMISTFCPVINRLIETQYPMLLENQVDFEYPSVIAARQIRQKYAHLNCGIFLLCECPSKLALAKYPYGNTQTEIDHALSIVDYFPLINGLRNEDRSLAPLCAEGIKFVACGLGSRFDKQILSVNGLDKVIKALELAEFGLLKEVKYLSLSACYNGCIGGQFLWGNSFNGRINMHELLKEAKPLQNKLALDQMKRTHEKMDAKKKNSMADRIRKFKAINEAFDHLPGYDCGACGFPSCRAMAEAIAEGHQSVHDCKILGRRGENES